MINHILLATDGSAPAERAAELAASIALRYHARVTIVQAYGPCSDVLARTQLGGSQPRTMEEVRAGLASISKRMRDMGISQVETEAIAGPATSVIVGTAESRRPDLLVISARGQGTWQGQMLGSVSMAVTQRVECPVLVVK